jgi:peptidyl-prolyl cis-trans isomerase SurA
MYREVMTDIAVTEPEIRQYYKDNKSELPQRPATITLAQILIIPKASEDLRIRAQERIELIEAEIRAGKDFAEAAKEYSEDAANAELGGSLGYIKLEDLGSPPFEKATRKLMVGEMSPPVLTRFGYHLIKLEAVSGDEVKLRHILIMLQSGESDIEAAALRADEVRQEILAGADFGEMARKHSDDEKTRDSGGEIEGDIVLENLVGRADYFLEVIKDVGPGEISPVIREPNGFRIVKVLSRNEPRAYTYREARDELEKLIEQQKMQQRFKDYVDELRGIYYVDVKEDG